ncbi:hypothetical protein Ga0061079_106135 [Apibacter mensalis]|uniref:Uncharacterized protein n=1 Tax=Apibacter mensalis TaxID=1586267 RepID=A0A0X3AMG6_9FLAO|nr:hypothetical protein [Apibacter mensalis]CVK16369.1 hypothetical protein Ga0061079_106135 [Apibacter mensalis]
MDYGRNQINYTDLDPVEVVGNNSSLPDCISGAYNHAVTSDQYGRYSPYKPDAFSFSIGIAGANGDAALVVGTGGRLRIKPNILGVKPKLNLLFMITMGIMKVFWQGLLERMLAGEDPFWWEICIQRLQKM